MNQRHIYLERPDIIEQRTRVIAVRGDGDAVAVALEDNLHRAAGGGEPADRGSVNVEGREPWTVSSIEKVDGKTWLLVNIRNDNAPVAGMPVIASVDARFRTAKRRLHTLEHMTVAIALRKLPGLVVTNTHIEDDASAAVIVGDALEPIVPGQIEEIDSAVRSAVLSGGRVYFVKALSVENARQTYGSLFRLNERYNLSGKVRLVIIEGVDVNPCSGCHYDTTDVGSYSLTRIHDATRPRHFHIRLESTKAWTYWYGDRVSTA